MNRSTAMPDVVYHYTSMDTLLEIVKHSTLRATSISYLNDVAERSLLFNELRERLRHTEHVPLSDLEALTGIMERYDASTARSFMTLPFVSSFSAESDSLPQWRAYCPHGNGVAIGFRTESLRTARAQKKDKTQPGWKSPTCHFGAVSYHTPGDVASSNEIFQSVSDTTTEKLERMKFKENPIVTRADFLLGDFEVQASLIKHRSFESEAEYRLVVNFLVLNGVFDFRASRSTLVPFTNVELTDPQEFLHTPSIAFGHRVRTEVAKPYFIHEVVIGPTPHQSLSLDALTALFQARGRDVEIRSSRSPFRDTI